MNVKYVLGSILVLAGVLPLSHGQVVKNPGTIPPPTTQPAHLPLKPDKLPGVENFGQISPVLYRGEQPTAQGFMELKKLGVKTIVSLRTFHSDRDLLKGTGLQYIRIEANPMHPEEEDLLAFLKILTDPANQPVFVHCQHGADRTGYIVASYRMVEQGWSSDEAIEELHNFNFHRMFTQVPTVLKQLQAAEVKAKVEKTAPPAIETIK